MNATRGLDRLWVAVWWQPRSEAWATPRNSLTLLVRPPGLEPGTASLKSDPGPRLAQAGRPKANETRGRTPWRQLARSPLVGRSRPLRARMLGGPTTEETITIQIQRECDENGFPNRVDKPNRGVSADADAARIMGEVGIAWRGPRPRTTFQLVCEYGLDGARNWTRRLCQTNDPNLDDVKQNKGPVQSLIVREIEYFRGLNADTARKRASIVSYERSVWRLQLDLRPLLAPRAAVTTVLLLPCHGRNPFRWRRLVRPATRCAPNGSAVGPGRIRKAQNRGDQDCKSTTYAIPVLFRAGAA